MSYNTSSAISTFPVAPLPQIQRSADQDASCLALHGLDLAGGFERVLAAERSPKLAHPRT